MTDKVKKLALAGKGLLQCPTKPIKNMVEEEIVNLSRQEALEFLSEVDIPTSKVNVADAKHILGEQFAESVEFREALVKEANQSNRLSGILFI